MGQVYASYWDESYWSWPPIAGENGYIGSATSMRDADMYWFYDPDLMDQDDTVAFPLMRIERGFHSFWWFGKLANGTRIAPGNYTSVSPLLSYPVVALVELSRYSSYICGRQSRRMKSPS